MLIAIVMKVIMTRMSVYICLRLPCHYKLSNTPTLARQADVHENWSNHTTHTMPHHVKSTRHALGAGFPISMYHMHIMSPVLLLFMESIITVVTPMTTYYKHWLTSQQFRKLSQHLICHNKYISSLVCQQQLPIPMHAVHTVPAALSSQTQAQQLVCCWVPTAQTHSTTTAAT